MQTTLITSTKRLTYSKRSLAFLINRNVKKWGMEKYTYNVFQNKKSTNTAFYLENTTDNVANFCFYTWANQQI
jgi:hypothetical protein